MMLLRELEELEEGKSLLIWLLIYSTANRESLRFRRRSIMPTKFLPTLSYDNKLVAFRDKTFLILVFLSP
jgi:hypothetical protein